MVARLNAAEAHSAVLRDCSASLARVVSDLGASSASSASLLAGDWLSRAEVVLWLEDAAFIEKAYDDIRNDHDV